MNEVNNDITISALSDGIADPTGETVGWPKDASPNGNGGSDWQTRLEHALAKAPSHPNHSPRFGAINAPVRIIIPSMAHAILIMAPEKRKPRASSYDASGATTKKELAKIRDRAEALLDSLDALHKPAVTVLSDAGILWPKGNLGILLRVLMATIDHAEIANTPSARGAKQKQAPAKIANFLCEYWPVLTARPATITTRIRDMADGLGGYEATGPFISVLNEIYQILEIRASPEAQARAAIGLTRKLAV